MNTMQSPAVAQLIAWAQAARDGDTKQALAHHDAVCAHIKETGMGDAIFEAAHVSLEAFIAWGQQKDLLREQEAKSEEQVAADYAEANEQLIDLVEKLEGVKSSGEVIEIAGHIRDAMAQLVINAGAMDRKALPEAEEKSEETVDEQTESE